jgi:DNA-binding beta-propeller fold protein YncE
MSVALDATRVYWVNSGQLLGSDGVVESAALDGSDAVTLASNQMNPQIVVVDASNVYWTNQAGCNSGAGSVMAVAKNGGSPWTIASGLNCPRAIAVDPSGIYWGDADGIHQASVGDAGTLRTLARFALGNGLGGIALSPTTVYWTNMTSGTDEGTILSVPK